MARIFHLDRYRQPLTFSIDFTVERDGNVGFIVEGLSLSPKSCRAIVEAITLTADALDDIAHESEISLSNDNKPAPPLRLM